MWRFADVVVDSDAPLSGLPAADGPADIIIRHSGRDEREPRAWSHLQTWTSEDEAETLATIERGQDGYRVSFAALTAHITTDGSRVQYTAADDCPESLVRHLLLHQVLPLCVSRRGRLVLHACAVTTAHGIVAIVGDAGAGKSTLTAAVCASGALLVADDALVVDFGTGASAVLRAIPSADGLRLWSDIPVPLPSTAVVAEGHPVGAKRHIAVPLATQPAPLVRLVFVGDIDGLNTTVQSVPSEKARVDLLRHVFRLDVDDAEESRRLFDAVHRLVTRVPARALMFPEGAEYLPRAVEAVLRDLDG